MCARAGYEATVAGHRRVLGKSSAADAQLLSNNRFCCYRAGRADVTRITEMGYALPTAGCLKFQQLFPRILRDEE
jgi:hypothetical protein